MIRVAVCYYGAISCVTRKPGDVMDDTKNTPLWPAISPELLFADEFERLLQEMMSIVVMGRMFEDTNHMMLYGETRLRSTERLLTGQSFGL